RLDEYGGGRASKEGERAWRGRPCWSRLRPRWRPRGHRDTVQARRLYAMNGANEGSTMFESTPSAMYTQHGCDPQPVVHNVRGSASLARRGGWLLAAVPEAVLRDHAGGHPRARPGSRRPGLGGHRMGLGAAA